MEEGRGHAVVSPSADDHLLLRAAVDRLLLRSEMEERRGQNHNLHPVLKLQACLSEVVSEDMCIKPFTVRLSDTISEIKEQVCDKLIEGLGQTYAAEPELFGMLLIYPRLACWRACWRNRRRIVLDYDTTKTLGQVLIDAGLMKDLDWEWESESESLVDVDTDSSDAGYTTHGDSLNGEADLTSNSSGDDKESSILTVVLSSPSTKLEKEGEDFDSKVESDIDSKGESDIDSEGECDDDMIDTEDAFSVKRPDVAMLPDDIASFHVFGLLVACRRTDQGVKRRCIPYFGLSYPLECVTELTTPASHVLLAFNPENLLVLEKLSYEMRTTTTSYILCLQVNWDKLSYLFLRKLRQHLDPKVPILAVTDLDIHQFDLLAFLNTPPHDLPKLYGWDLSQDCAHVGVQDVENFNIKWPGIRPSDSKDTSPYHSCFAEASSKLPDDFHQIYNSLMDHPHFGKKPNWDEELRLISDRKLQCSLPYLSEGLHWGFKRYVCEYYLPQKIKQRDWL